MSPAVGLHLKKISESLDSNSPRERGGKTGLGREHSRMAAVSATSSCTYRENLKERPNEYARTGTAGSIRVYSEDIKDKEGKKVIECSLNLFFWGSSEEPDRKP